MDSDTKIETANSENIRSLKEAIKARRLSKKMNQTEVAELSGVKQPSISILESKNHDRVSLDLVQKVAAVLGLAVEIRLIDMEKK